MAVATPAPQIDFRLGRQLRQITAQLRAARFHRQGVIVWSTVALLAAALALAQLWSPALAPYAAPVLFVVFVAGGVTAMTIAWRDRTNLRDAARHVELLHPELRHGVQAAVEQHPDRSGHFNFLQRRVIADALRHADTHDWLDRPRRHARWLLGAHVLAMVAALGLSFVVVRAHRPAASDSSTAFVGETEVTPGNTEVERGSAVVITARFGGAHPPGEAVLVWQPDGGSVQRATMHRSLSDPVFAFTLTSVGADTAYHVEHNDARTAAYTLAIFDRPALLRADASLDYPDYTGLADRRVTDTRRVSAVTGTNLVYDFAMNKPLARATLHHPDGRQVALDPANADRTQFRLSTTIVESARLTLHLEDQAGRTNPAPIELRIEALENRRPELKLTFPRGDQRVSPLEEIQLQAEARDDFGLRDYGVGVSIAEGAPEYVSFVTTATIPAVEANFLHKLALESHGVKPDQLVTWFAWADDVGPDGQVRRTTSDIYFSEVRPLDEIFRENATGGGGNQPGGAGGPGEELIETQRQISIAIWKLRQQDAANTTFRVDAHTLRDSQQEALRQLETARERLEDARARAAADDAAPAMRAAAESLADAAAQSSNDPLTAAWSHARNAYQALLRLQSRDTQVGRAQGGGAGGGQRGRDQLNQLEFRHEQDRYQTETQAQAPPTPEEREQLQVLARLRELARRQQDLNARLQELQTALAAAEDEKRREEIRRELKRLEDEQRRMLADLDETRQRVDQLQPGQRTQEARQQLDQTREDMQRAGEQLAQGEVTQALASGTRAGENLQRTSEDLRREAAGRFGEQMREARRQARELSTQQQSAARELDELSRGRQSLDDSEQRETLARRLQEQAERRAALLDGLRQVTEESEGTEPRLHRQLYDLLRQQGQSGAGQQLAASAEMLRRGFVDPARDQQADLAREFEQLHRAVERAAAAVLGDETSELRFAQRELEDLTRELQRDRGKPDPDAATAGNSGEPRAGNPDAAAEINSQRGLADTNENRPAGAENPTEFSDERAQHDLATTSLDGTRPDSAEYSTGDPAGDAPRTGDAPVTVPDPGSGEAELGGLEQLAREFGEASRAAEAARGPLTGAGFGEWAERLRTVEELMETPELRQRLATARFGAEEIRRAHQRDGQPPRWDLVDLGVVAPLEEVRGWVRQELRRRDQPDALQPIDRDPVPERYAESVRKYYEALGDE